MDHISANHPALDQAITIFAFVERTFSEEELFARARNYCARQERCQQEVRDKLYTWGGHKGVVENILSQLIGERFLNEVRFAEHFAVSKFRQKGWGRRKIEAALKAKNVSSQCIRKGLECIDDEDYERDLVKAIQKRIDRLGPRDPYVLRSKVFKYFLGKGYSTDLIDRSLRKLEY